MPVHSRRDFLISAGAASVGFIGMQRLFGTAHAGELKAGSLMSEGFGPLRPDPAKIIDLPEGFTYRIISRLGDEMDDGLLVPGAPDGMAAFEGPDGLTIIVRNHELSNGQVGIGAFGRGGERASKIDRSRIYDPGRGGIPALGGTSTIVYDTAEHTVVREFMSSAGHCRNCAGGPTPWGSWLTCEETVIRAGEDGADRDHGYVFEVPATAEIGLADPTPIKGMGRFNHEAVCVDPATGIVYLTEDRGDGLLYRYIPNTPGKMLDGGTLQALKIRNMPSFDTRNWDSTDVRVGHELGTEWIDLDNIDPVKDDLRTRGYEAGAARFARGEGIHWADGSAYAVCTSGGRARKGQVWRYTPGEREGTSQEKPGKIALFVEPNDGDIVDMPDNIGVAPWGDLVLCEDGGGDQFLVGVTPEGRLYKLARNAQNSSEFAGACFSPDGTTMFVNIQHTGLTLAITGPWRT
jgi:secreted PhoX family phosphatase